MMWRALCRQRVTKHTRECATPWERRYGTSLSSRDTPKIPYPNVAGTFDEAIAALRTHQDGNLDAVAKHTASRINSDTPLADILAFADACKARKLKQPLLEVLLKMELSENSDADVVAELLLIMGQAQLYPSQLFEWLYEHVGKLSPRGMTLFLYECGRHGLRCKHFADRAVPNAASMVPQMSLEQVMMTTRGLIRFVRDWKVFFEAARPVYQANLAELSNEDWTLVLRVTKEFRTVREFRRLQELAVTAKDAHDLPLSTVVDALMRLDQHRTIKMGRAVQRFVQQAADSMSRRRDNMHEISAVEAIDALDSLSTWTPAVKVDQELLEVLGDLLTSRITEIKYSPNVALWSRATSSFSKFYFYHKPWMEEITVFARDRFIVDKISFFQQCTFVAALARLGFADPVSFQCIGDLMMENAELMREPSHASPVLWAFTVSNQVHRPLFDCLVDKMVTWADDSSANSLIQSLYCFVATGYHLSHDLSPLYEVCFVDEHTQNPQFKRRLQVIRDVVAAETNVSLPQVADFSHEIPTEFARQAVRMVPSAELVPTYGPCTLMQLRPSEKYGILLVDGKSLSTGEAPMEVILQGRILAAAGWSLCPPLFAKSSAWIEHGEAYLQHWAAEQR